MVKNRRDSVRVITDLKMEIENLGALASRDQSPILDLGDGFQ